MEKGSDVRLATWSLTNRPAVLAMMLCAAVLVLTSAAPARASAALTFGDTHEVGSLLYGTPDADSDKLNYVNHLVGMAVSTTDSADGQSFTRSASTFASLPRASSDSVITGSGTSIFFGTPGDFAYLYAKYDGPSDGVWVWYIGDQSGLVTLPSMHDTNALSYWTLFTSEVNRPDGRIRRSGGPLRGDDIYNADGGDQTVLLKMYAGDKRVAYITIQNDGVNADTFTVAASDGSVDGFQINYRIGRTTTDVTGDVEAGTFTTPLLAPGATYRLRVIARVNTLTPRRSLIERLVTISASANVNVSDTVEFVVRRK